MKNKFTIFFLATFFLLNSMVGIARNGSKAEFKSETLNVSLPSCSSQDEIESQFSTWKNAVVDYIYEFEGTEGCDEALNWTINGNGSVMSTQTCPSLYSNIINLFPEQENALEASATDNLFVENGFDPSDLNLVLNEETEVYISFVWEGASWTNTLGYYTYHIDNPPASVDDLEKHVLFENASITGGGGNLKTGDTKQIGNGAFSEGTVIGFYLVAKGWDNISNSMVEGSYTHYTTLDFNPDFSQQHTFFSESFDSGCGDLVMTFEDIRLPESDKDFNDLIFIIRTDVEELLLDLTTPGNCGGAVEVEWEFLSSCTDGDSGLFSFQVESLSQDDITFDLPANVNALFNSQDELDEAFAQWLANAIITGGCESGSIFTSPVQPASPSVCGGTVEVTWVYEDECVEFSQTRSFTTQTNVPVVNCPNDIFASTQDEPILLDGEGGIFEGPGVSFDEEAGVYVFAAAEAGVGQHILYYSVSNEAGCVNSCIFFAEVVAMPDFYCIPDFAVCSNDEIVELINIEYEDGIYSGVGIVDGTSFDPSVAGPGIHEITYTLDNEYGTFSCTFFITVNTVPEITLAPFASVCTNTESFILTGGLPEGGVYSGTGITDGMFNPSDLVEGVYDITYTLTNDNDCSASAVQTIEVKLAPCLKISHTDACFGETNGSIIVDVTCGNVVELCLIYPGEASDKCTPDKIGGAVYNNLAPGTYIVVATADNGCTTIEEVVVEETSEVVLELFSFGDVSEYGAGDGFLEVAASGGTPEYQYLWEFGETTALVQNLDPGSYNVVALDANNCSASGTFQVGGPTQPADILVDLGVTIEVNIQTPDPEEVDELIFALVVTNLDSEETATNVVVENVIPQPFPFITRLDDGTSGSFDHFTGKWTIGNIPPGEYRILVYRSQMLLTEADDKNWQSGLNTAQILPFDQIDPVPENNYAEILVTVGESSGGDDNGIESNGSMAAQLALRNHRRLVENREIARTERIQQMESFNHVSMLTGDVKSATVSGETATGIGMLLPEDGPAKTKAFVSTPYDLLGITNAKEIFSVDYLQENNARRAAVLAISTESSSVYEHTKVICDRLMGAELQSVEMIEIAGKPFILSHLVHPNGYIDYSVSFIAQRKGGEFVIDNRWYNEEYQLLNSDDIFNFQVWSVTPQFTRELVEEIIENMDQHGGVSFRNEDLSPEIPQVYVHSGRYTNGGLLLTLINKVGADRIIIEGNKTLFENAQREPLYLTLDIPTAEVSEVFIPTGFLFDVGFSVTNNKDNASDVLYYADGAWMFDYDPENSTVTHFSIEAENNEIGPVDYKVERDASFSGRVRTWATMFRSLSPRNMPVDIGEFDQIVFNAKGEGVVEVMLAKKSISDWNDQYRTTITLSDDEKEYRIAFEDFLTKEGMKGFTAEDVVSVIFNSIGNGTVASNFDVNVSNLHFVNSRFVDAIEAIFYPAYPNPFKQTTTMDVMVKQDNSLVKVEVLNMFGQTIEVLANEEMGMGSFKINWDPVSHGPGVYMIKTTVGESVYTSKVIYNK